MKKPKIKISVINKKEAFYRLESEWKAISDELTNKTIFHMYEWHKAYVDAIEKDVLPIYYIVLYENTRVIAIFPVEIYKKKALIFKFSILRNPDCFTMDAPIRDFIYAQDDSERDILKLLLSNLKKQTDFAIDAVFLDYILDVSSVFESFKKSTSILSYCEDGKYCDYLNLDSYDQIYSNYSKSLKKGLKKSRRKLSKLGKVEYVIDKNRVDIEKSFNEFLEIESSGWKGRKDGSQEGQAIKLDKKQLAFYKKLISQFAEMGNCQMHSLKLEDATIASNILLKVGSIFYGLKMAYDEKYAKNSPSIILLDNMVQYLSKKEDITQLNFLSGSTWAQRWRPNKYSGFKLFLFNKTIKGIVYYLSFSINRWLNN